MDNAERIAVISGIANNAKRLELSIMMQERVSAARAIIELESIIEHVKKDMRLEEAIDGGIDVYSYEQWRKSR